MLKYLAVQIFGKVFSRWEAYFPAINLSPFLPGAALRNACCCSVITHGATLSSQEQSSLGSDYVVLSESPDAVVTLSESER